MRAVILTTLAVALAAPAGAQQQQHQHGQQGQGQQPMMQQQMGGGMQGGGNLPGPLRGFAAYAPDKVLAMKEMLSLTADQEAALTKLVGTGKAAVDEAHAPAMAAMRSLRAEMEKPSPDPETMRAFVVAHATAEGNMQWARVEAAMKAKALLTEAQRHHIESMK